MAHAPIILRRNPAQVTEGVVHIDGLTSRDADVAHLIATADDPETAVRRALHLGARTLRLAENQETPPAE